MNESSLLTQIKLFDLQSRRDRCSGVIGPATRFFSRRKDLLVAKEELLPSRPHQLFVCALAVVGGGLLQFVGTWLGWLLLFWSVALVVGRSIEVYRVTTKLEHVEDHLLLLSSAWQSAGGSSRHFDQLNDLSWPGGVDTRDEGYSQWRRAWDKHLKVILGLEEEFDVR